MGLYIPHSRNPLIQSLDILGLAVLRLAILSVAILSVAILSVAILSVAGLRQAGMCPRPNLCHHTRTRRLLRINRCSENRKTPTSTMLASAYRSGKEVEREISQTKGQRYCEPVYSLLRPRGSL